MLREIFRTVPVPYRKQGEEFGGYPFGAHYPANIDPWVESIWWWTGIYVSPHYPTPESPTSIYLFSILHMRQWPSWGFGFYRFDGKSGKLIKRFNRGGGLGTILAIDIAQSSRSGVLYFRQQLQPTIAKVDLGATATALVGDEPEIDDTWTLTDFVNISRFGPYNEDGDRLLEFGHAGMFAIDDLTDIYIDGSFRAFRVFEWSTGVHRYTIEFPDNIVDIALEDANHCYVLMGNQTLVLFDYMRGEVMGAVKIPSLLHETNYWNNGDIRITWDATFRRLLVIEVAPNNPDGSSASYVRGFRQVPEATRVTTPIPLKVPRQGRTIPVLVQVVGDLNEGVGGYVLDVQVSGSGALAGIPISDHRGDTLVQIACGEPGATEYGDYGYDYEYGGAALDPGSISLHVTATVYEPDPPDVPPSGSGRTTTPGAPGTGETPGQPGGGEGSGGLPETAPNMTYILAQVLDAGAPNGQPWNLAESNSQAANGRGKFTEVAVTALHDVDPRWGHIKKNPGQNQFNGHSVDAINYKSADGTTAEIIDIVAGRNTPPYLIWAWDDRSSANLEKWYYPA